MPGSQIGRSARAIHSPASRSPSPSPAQARNRCLINNDTQILFAATYSDEFKPYVLDVIKFATPWIDYMFTGVGEGYQLISQ